jgi:predicted acylesterase/phospholipase RssA/CRP-like cAMP-binding protein
MTRTDAAAAADLLADCPLFRELALAVRRELALETAPVRLGGGETLMREGDAGDAMYVVVSGRLSVVVTTAAHGEHSIAEIGRGETVGEMALVTGAPRSATVRGVRDSVLLRLSKSSFDGLIERHPAAMMALARVIVKRLEQSTHAPSPPAAAPTTFAVAAAGIDAPLASAARMIAEQLARHGAVLHLSSERLRSHGDAPVDEKELAGWLDAQERTHRFVVYECDDAPTSWTRRCLRQADRIVLAARAATHPGLSSVEESLLDSAHAVHHAKIELVLVHDDASRAPSRAAKWLAGRHVAAHHHVRLGVAADAERIGRRLAGCAVGVVLGGGGARGFAHLGVLRALEECGVPIDAIGGNSMGAIVGGLFACGYTHEERMERCRDGFAHSAPDADYTLPLVALHSGAKGNRLLRGMYGDARIEDLWRTFFCVSTNLNTAELRVARDGPMWRWVRASCSAPGMAPPIIEEGQILVDGGILDNLPVRAMRLTEGVGVTIASDAGATGGMDSTLRSLDAVSGWRVLWDRLRGSSRAKAIPNLADILMRTATLSSVSRQIESSRDADVYLRPPSDGVRTTEWTGLDRAVDAGYRYAMEHAGVTSARLGPSERDDRR